MCRLRYGVGNDISFSILRRVRFSEENVSSDAAELNQPWPVRMSPKIFGLGAKRPL